MAKQSGRKKKGSGQRYAKTGRSGGSKRHPAAKISNMGAGWRNEMAEGSRAGDQLQSSASGSDMLSGLSADDLALIAGITVVIADGIALLSILKARQEKEEQSGVTAIGATSATSAAAAAVGAASRSSNSNDISDKYVRFTKGRLIRR